MDEEKTINQLRSQIRKLEDEISQLSGDPSSEGAAIFLETLQDIYFRCDLNGEITRLNPAVGELTGYDPDEILHKNITNYYLYNPKIKNLIRRLIRDGQVRNFEASVVKSNGDILQCLCNIRLLRSPDGHQIEGMVRDITELKKVNAELLYAKELAERSLKVKEKFLANMSHEIRTPLNGIIGMIDLISKTSLDSQQSEYLQTIKKSSEILLYILNDILEISKIEAGKVKLRRKPVSIHEILNKVRDLFMQEAARNGISFRINQQADIPGFLILDETRLLQIFSNLISNAIKFTDEGGSIDINLSLVHRESSSCKILIEVVDSGIGISEELQGNLFESFSQLDNSLTKQYSGTGLGLAISQELCRLMGSEIKVDSAPGKGSKFWFQLIAEIADKGEEPRQTEESHENIELAETPKILLVDDNKINRDVARHILVGASCEVTEAEGGKKSIDLVKNNSYDLIIMDIQMPDMDGIEAMKLIRGLGLPALAPIIAMTAYAMETDESRFLEEGFDGYLAKPIRAESLIKSVSGWIRKGTSGTTQDLAREQDGNKNVLDFKVVDSLRKIGGETLVKETYKEFEEEAGEFLQSINKALTKSDYSSILSLLHTLKGNAGTLGIERIHVISAKIESDIKNQDLNNLEKDMKILNAAFAEYKEKYRILLTFS